MLNNGVGLSTSGNSWSSNGNATTDRWNSSTSMIPVGRSLPSSGAFNNSWTGAAPPLSSSSVYNPSTGTINSLSNAALGQSGPVNYSGERYSRH